MTETCVQCGSFITDTMIIVHLDPSDVTTMYPFCSDDCKNKNPVVQEAMDKQPFCTFSQDGDDSDVWDCEWICSNCKFRNSNWSDEPNDKWICSNCQWCDWEEESEIPKD